MITKIKSHKEFYDLAEIYKYSLRKINLMIIKTTDKGQLSILRSASRDLKESIEELENYYRSSYWRSEKITMNTRKSTKIYFNNIDEMIKTERGTDNDIH